MEKLEFYSFAKQKDGGEYCSDVETYAENMIEGAEQESSIVYPSPTKFATFRAPDYRLTTDTLHMVLPLPIYKIVKVYIMAGSTGTEYANYENYKDGNGNSYIPDVTRFVVTDKEWSALPDFVDGGYTWGSNLAKSNTITYSKGSNEIWISSTENKRNSIEERTPTYLGMIMSSFTNVTTTAYYYNGDTSNFSLRDAVNNGFFTELNIADVRNWQFQIEYIPMTPATKVKALKAEATPRRYTQLVNQRAEVNSSDAFGKYLHTTAQKTGTEKIAVAKKYTKLSEVPPIGALIKHNGQRYRLVANSWKVTNTVNFTVTHLLSKNWSSKSKHVAVDQKYRNWNIPFDSYIRRTIYHEEFINLSGTAGTHDSSFAKKAVENAHMSFFRMEPKDMELRMLTFAKGEDIQAYSGAVVPTVTQGVGHSIVISATMKDNISAGLRVNPDNGEYCTDVIYCNDDGTLDSGFIILANDIDKYHEDKYPACSYNKGMLQFSNNPKGMEEDPETAYFLANYWIDKDPGEALKFTIQAHFVPREEWIVVGSKLAQTHPFVTNKPHGVFKLWVLPRYIRDGVDVLDPADVEGAYSKTLYSSSDMAWYFQSAVNKVEAIRTIFEEAEAEGIVGKSWVLTDGYNNIYIGSNDITKREIYFTWTSKAEFNPEADNENEGGVGGGSGGSGDGDGGDNEPEIETILFTINDITYQAEKDSTWGEWLDSEYNTAGFAYTDSDSRVWVGPSISGSTTYQFVTYKGFFVSRADFIVNGREYDYSEKENIKFKINGVSFEAADGMTWLEFLQSDYDSTGLGHVTSGELKNYVLVMSPSISNTDLVTRVTYKGKFVLKTAKIIANENYGCATEENVPIYFYVGSKAYEAADGMTWKEFIESDYSHPGLSLSTNSYRVYVAESIAGTAGNYVTYNGKWVFQYDQIVNGRRYAYADKETDLPVDNGTPIYPENPWEYTSENYGTVVGEYYFNFARLAVATEIGIDEKYHKANVSFTSNGRTFSSISTKYNVIHGASFPQAQGVEIYYDDILVYDGNLNATSNWIDNGYRSIDFGEGALLPIYFYTIIRIGANALNFDENGLAYAIDFDKSYYIVKGVWEPDGNIVDPNYSIKVDIPETYNGKPVKYIHPYAFSYNKYVTGITIGGNVKQICKESFYNCYNLESLYIPSSVESIGEKAFYDIGASVSKGCVVTYDGTYAEFDAICETPSGLFGGDGMNTILVCDDITLDLTQ